MSSAQGLTGKRLKSWLSWIGLHFQTSEVQEVITSSRLVLLDSPMFWLTCLERDPDSQGGSLLSLLFSKWPPSCSVDFNLGFIFIATAVHSVLLWAVLVCLESLPLQSLSSLSAIIHHTDILEAVIRLQKNIRFYVFSLFYIWFGCFDPSNQKEKWIPCRRWFGDHSLWV